MVTIKAAAFARRLALGSLLIAAAPHHALAQAGTRASDMTRQDYEACQARDEAQFREAIERVTVRALEASVRGLDYQPIVAEAWRQGGVDEVMARQVDAALEALMNETSWSERIASLASKEAQEKLAKSAAERVYGSEKMKRAIEDLAVRVGRVVAERLDVATADAAEPTTRCLEAFLGPRYGMTVARTVASDAGKGFAVDAAKAAAPVTRGSILAESKEGLAGLVVVIMRRQLGNLSSRVGQRLVGAVLGRVVSVVAGGIGVVLIAKDIWELRNGVLPIIASEMKAPVTRDRVQGELASSVATEIEAQLKDIGKRTSERVIEIWHEFRRAHAKVLEIADRDDKFKAFIDNVSPGNLGRLDEVVSLQLAEGGETRLRSRVADGSLAEAVERWPTGVLEIARDRRSLEAGFKWRALAGDQLIPNVLEFEVHRRGEPEEFSKRGLQRVLSLNDRVATGRLAALKRRALEPLLEIGDSDLKRLARSLGEAELASLSGYLTTLDAAASKRLLAMVAEAPSRMQSIASGQVRDAILASRDQAMALSMMLRSNDLFDVGDFLKDIETVRSGAVSPYLLVWRYPIALTGVALLAIALVAMIWRAIAGRRPRRRGEAAGT